MIVFRPLSSLKLALVESLGKVHFIGIGRPDRAHNFPALIVFVLRNKPRSTASPWRRSFVKTPAFGLYQTTASLRHKTAPGQTAINVLTGFVTPTVPSRRSCTVKWLLITMRVSYVRCTLLSRLVIQTYLSLREGERKRVCVCAALLGEKLNRSWERAKYGRAIISMYVYNKYPSPSV